MSRMLAALGRASYRRRGRVVVIWLLLLVILGAGALAFGKSDGGGSLSVPGTESQEALDALASEFPAAAGASGTITIRSDDGTPLATGSGAAAVAQVVAEAQALPDVVVALGPDVTQAYSQDAMYALVQVQFDATDPYTLDQSVKDAFLKVGSDVAGVTVAPGGGIIQGVPEVGGAEGIGVAIAALVLVLTFGSLVAAGMTLLTALVGVGVGMSGVLLLSSFVDFTSVTPILALMLGLAVGIDYALFINSRYRQHLAEGLDGETSAGLAVGTAGSAVVFAGVTVIVALAGLSVVGVPFLGVMGIVAAVAIAVAVAVAITLTPAIAGYAGRRLLDRRTRSGAVADTGATPAPAAASAAGAAPNGATRPSLGARWAMFVTSRPWTVVIVSVVALVAIALPAATMRLALPDNASAPEGSGARVSYDLTTEGFGPGFNSQLTLVTTSDSPEATATATAELAAAVAPLADVIAVAPANTSENGLTSVTQVIPRSGPHDEATVDLVGQLRDDVVPGIESATGTNVAVTGLTAAAIDVSDTLDHALPIYLLLVVGLSFVLLMIVFRSVLVPLKAALGFLLTTVATFGLTTAVFQHGWASDLFGVHTPAPLISFLPILLVGILFGLSMDYEVFLLSRMREEYTKGATAREAIISGFTHASRVVGAAAVIMISVFAGFVLAHDLSIKTIGFALAVGVLIDAFVVRMTIVPAVMALLGDRAWWLPRWLDRLLPNLDIEGAALEIPVVATEVEADRAVPVG